MSTAIIGKKIGMMQQFADDGSVIPLTVVQAGPCVVVQRKTKERDGYDAVQLGLVEGTRYRANKPTEGHFKNAGTAPVRIVREFPLSDAETKVGDTVKVSAFEGIDKVTVSGISKGKGFAGVIKRHGFGGGKATHGSMHHRAPGSIGQSAWPSKVMKGMKGPGRLGGDRVTVKGLAVVEVIDDQNLILIKGAVPGAKGSYLEIVG